MVQVLIAMAMMGGLTVTVMQLSQQQAKIRSSAYETLAITETIQRVQRNMADETACLYTLKGIELEDDAEKSINNIKNKNSHPII